MVSGSGPTLRLSARDRLELQQRVRAGARHVDAAAAVGCSAKSVQRLLRSTGGIKPRRTVQSLLRLSLAEREEILCGLRDGDSCRAIASRLGRAASTVSRDVAANGTRERYRAWRADDRAERRRRRRRIGKLTSCVLLRHVVECGLQQRWSPQQIVARLVQDYPDAMEMRVSHETIYQALYVQARGALRATLTRHLRTGRVQRRPHGRIPGTGQLVDMVLLADRPTEVDDRVVPGHWEGDLVLGRRGQSAIATLVERQSRFVMLVRLPQGRLANDVANALTTVIRTLPLALRRSLTWDRGKEMGEHRRFTIDTGVQVYFCDPRSPWQRGTNENSNGLIRQYLPQGTDLTNYSQRQLNNIADELNGRPRQTLEWRTPSEAFTALVR